MDDPAILESVAIGVPLDSKASQKNSVKPTVVGKNSVPLLKTRITPVDIHDVDAKQGRPRSIAIRQVMSMLASGNPFGGIPKRGVRLHELVDGVVPGALSVLSPRSSDLSWLNHAA